MPRHVNNEGDSMGIGGFLIKEVHAEREDEWKGSVSVTNNVNVKSVKHATAEKYGKDCIEVGFEISSKYSNESGDEVAKMLATGNVLLFDEDTERIMQDWKKSKELPDDLHVAVLNLVLRKCLTKFMALADDLGLPPPVGLPYAQRKAEE